MDWFYESKGVWVATAALLADDVALSWRISIEKTGLFSTAFTDSELQVSGGHFVTLAQAVAECECREAARLRDDGRCSCGGELHPGVDGTKCPECWKAERGNELRDRAKDERAAK
jgi:hypothetical protein